VSFLVDTDICSAYLRGNNPVTTRFVQYGGRIGISAITAAELFAWSLRSKAPAGRISELRQLLRIVQLIEVDGAVAERWGAVRAGQLDGGHQTPRIDLLIAATALVHGFSLVTHNTKDYSSIAGLTLVDWLTP